MRDTHSVKEFKCLCNVVCDVSAHQRRYVVPLLNQVAHAAVRCPGEKKPLSKATHHNALDRSDVRLLAELTAVSGMSERIQMESRGTHCTYHSFVSSF